MTTPPVKDDEKNRKLLHYAHALSLPSCESQIAVDPTEKAEILRMIGKTEIPEEQLIYRASKDGFSADSFHSRVDNKGPTLIICKAENGRIFGGYTDISWTSPEDD